MKTLEVIVKGLVQGVGYRYFALREAKKLNINGYVKNLINGNVLVIIQGEEYNLQEFINILRRGPISSDVRELTIREIESEQFENFNIEY